MDSRRAETLEALSTYLHRQKTLLARTQADIDRLRKLRENALAYPEQFHRTCQESDASPPRIQEELSDLQDYHPAHSFPSKIDWETFSSSDPTPLRTVAIRTRIDHTQRNVPSSTQRSPLSFLQKFVKDARKVILDPVFESLSASTDMVALCNPTVPTNLHVNPSSNDHNRVPTLTLPSRLSEDENEERHPAQVAHDSLIASRKRERARGTIRDLKKRKIKLDLIVGCKLGEEGSNGVSDRRDIEDETAEVDMNTEAPQSCISTPLDAPLEQISHPMDADVSMTALEDVAQYINLPDPHRTPRPIAAQHDNANQPSRPRKLTLKLRSQSVTALAELKNEPPPTPLLQMPSQSLGKRCRDIAEINDMVCKPKSELLSVAEVNVDTAQNRSETYKQAWSISEQHLLERLLEEIPDGERNRWAKISQAMGGHRTPRQVASRVQKYFEKLKRFGVGMDNKGKAKS